MPTANPAQQGFLEPLRDEVLEVMQGLFALDKEDMALLSEVKLGVLRSNATQRHGATRWQRLPDGSLNLEVVDLHPALLVKAWRAYALFVLYHEFIHVLGHRAHDATFRNLERLWPDQTAAQQGKDFTHDRRLARARWHWVCPTCEQRYPRQRRGSGRFLCKACKTVLIDVPVKDIQ